MSWRHDGTVKCGEFKFKGIRNKRNRKSPKAIAARKARMEKLSRSKRHGRSDGDHDRGYGDSGY